MQTKRWIIRENPGALLKRKLFNPGFLPLAKTTSKLRSLSLSYRWKTHIYFVRYLVSWDKKMCFIHHDSSQWPRETFLRASIQEENCYFSVMFLNGSTQFTQSGKEREGCVLTCLCHQGNLFSYIHLFLKRSTRCSLTMWGQDSSCRKKVLAFLFVSVANTCLITFHSPKSLLCGILRKTADTLIRNLEEGDLPFSCIYDNRD